MPARIHSRDEIVHRLMQTFREHGYEGASLSRISKLTGLGKASLYHHFPGGKEEMGIAVLQRVGEWMEEHVRRPLAQSGSPRERLQRMIDALEEFYAGGSKPCLLELFAVGEAQSSFGRILGETSVQWQNAMADVLTDAGFDRQTAEDKALDALIRIQGSLIVARAQNDLTPFRHTMSQLPETMLSKNS